MVGQSTGREVVLFSKMEIGVRGGSSFYASDVMFPSIQKSISSIVMGRLETTCKTSREFINMRCFLKTFFVVVWQIKMIASTSKVKNCSRI